MPGIEADLDPGTAEGDRRRPDSSHLVGLGGEYVRLVVRPHRVESGHARRTEREIGIDRDDERGDQQRRQNCECGQRKRKAAEVRARSRSVIGGYRGQEMQGLTVEDHGCAIERAKVVQRPKRSTRPEAARSWRHTVSDRDRLADSYQQVASAWRFGAFGFLAAATICDAKSWFAATHSASFDLLRARCASTFWPVKRVPKSSGRARVESR